METDYYRKVIKEYRKEKKLSQEKFAELLGYDTTYMSHIETGKREPSVDFFIRFQIYQAYLSIICFVVKLN